VPEDRCVEAFGRREVGEPGFGPDQRARLVVDLDADLPCGLPDAERGTAGVEPDEHAAVARDVERVDEHAAAGRAHELCSGVGVVAGQVDRPGRRLALLLE
jgi:hypothetical protein